MRVGKAGLFGLCLAVAGRLGCGAAVAADLPKKSASDQQWEAGAVHADITRYVLQAPAKLYLPVPGDVPALKRAFPRGLFPDVGSGLAFKGRGKGYLEFYGITDRGANSDGPGKVVNPAGAGSKFFPLADFHPSYGLIRVTEQSATLLSLQPLVDAQGHKPTGLPPPGRGKGPVEEVPLTGAMRFDATRATFDPLGLDTEAIVVDAARKALWVSDEYGPYILKVEPQSGRILEWLRPGEGPRDLPSVLGSRRANRGLENLALEASTGHLHGALQSPIDPLDANGKSLQATPPGGKPVDVKHAAKFIRWINYDPATGRSILHAYPVDGSLYEKGRTGAAKVGDITSLGDGRFLAIEQGSRAADGHTQNWLMRVEIPSTATDITAFGADLEVSSITGSAVNGADWSQVTPLRKTKLFDLNQAGWNAEKAEGLALVDAHTIALVNDNDFGIRTALVDGEGKELEGSIGDCTLDATAGTLTACATKSAVSARVVPARGPGTDVEFWLIRFDRDLTGP